MFYNEDHPYSSDLDLFGNGSLFQLLNRTSTNQGRSALANELLVDPEPLKVQEKQSAIRELSSQINWCQDFQVAGLVVVPGDRIVPGARQFVDVENVIGFVPGAVFPFEPHRQHTFTSP